MIKISMKNLTGVRLCLIVLFLTSVINAKSYMSGKSIRRYDRERKASLDNFLSQMKNDAALAGRMRSIVLGSANAMLGRTSSTTETERTDFKMIKVRFDESSNIELDKSKKAKVMKTEVIIAYIQNL
uniref:Uncharacterized protein n=1 Tax=Romanomermis culicivorax TaxID=13658 RepID=A0A915IZQ4_ROMCU